MKYVVSGAALEDSLEASMMQSAAVKLLTDVGYKE